MKNIYFIIGLLLSLPIFAQTQGISYQAVILNPNIQELPGVNATNNILPNKAITIRFTITNQNVTTNYQETQATTTDSYGMVNLFIGEGDQTSSNSFDEIDWDGTPKNLMVDIDFDGGNNFTSLGNQKLTFVAYAFHKNITATGDLTVDGTSTFNSDIVIEGEVTINNDLTIAGSSVVGEDLTVEGVTNLNGEFNVNNESISNLSGALNVEGEVIINNDLTIAGSSVVGEDLTVQGNSVLTNLIVRGGDDIGGGAGTNHIALFENTNPSNGNTADGIAIRIQGNESNKLGFRNRFITFYGNDDYVAGRIESYDLLAGDLWESFPIPDFANMIEIFDFNNVLQRGTLPSLTGGVSPSVSWNDGSLPNLHFHDDGIEFHRGSSPSLTFYSGSFPIFNIGSFPTFNFDDFFNPQAGINAQNDLTSMIAWGMRNGDPGFLPTSPWKIALTPLILAAKQVARDQGVIYGSKGADYAEWLEKENPEDKFMFGEVVGVKGGKISRVTEGADQVMSISLAPIVLGNMPDENRKKDFEKVGFMGQVPVLVLGDVEIGDYIVASGYNDGYAKAISSSKIELKNLRTIIGKAWTGSNGNKASIINVSVGLKTNEWVDILKQQESRLNNLESKLRDVKTLSNRLEKLESKLEKLEIN